MLISQEHATYDDLSSLESLSPAQQYYERYSSSIVFSATNATVHKRTDTLSSTDSEIDEVSITSRFPNFSTNSLRQFIHPTLHSSSLSAMSTTEMTSSSEPSSSSSSATTSNGKEGWGWFVGEEDIMFG
jgi:hypothetical protein